MRLKKADIHYDVWLYSLQNEGFSLFLETNINFSICDLNMLHSIGKGFPETWINTKFTHQIDIFNPPSQALGMGTPSR